MDKDAYIKAAKRTALEYLDKGNLKGAVASISNTLNKYPELRVAPDITLVGLIAASNNDAEGVREFINGFN